MEKEMKAFVEAMMAGDERAFDEIYHSYSKKLYRMAYFITGNDSDSEDILQETFVKCYLHRKELKNPEGFASWIYQILVRTAWRLEKKKKKTGEISYEGVLEQEDSSSARMARRLCEDLSAPNPLEALLAKESQTELGQVVKQLDIKYRTVVMLYYYNEMSVREIAKVMGIFEGTVKSRLSKARNLLYQQLENLDQDKVKRNPAEQKRRKMERKPAGRTDLDQEKRQNNQVKGAVL